MLDIVNVDKFKEKQMSEKAAKILYKFIREKDLSKRKFAKHAGISYFSILKYCNGLPIHPKTAQRMKDNLKQSLGIIVQVKDLID